MKAGKIIIGTAFVAAFGTSLYFLYTKLIRPELMKRRQSGGAGSSQPPPLPSSGTVPKPTQSSSTPQIVWPLKKGSKGAGVKMLQQALIDLYGSSILPRYGADGDFGSETESALISKGYLAQIFQKDFDLIIAGAKAKKERETSSGITGWIS
ncbi:MAG TPA: peptidoglycan-binding domain-containing protein [Sedimentisphaerales bacterium]|nr:peptidoglycan-binding domain-containing protein [Sedimentisphaerales bacterium]